MIDASGKVLGDVRTLSQGIAPELQAARKGGSTERQYRAELCQVLPTHAEQLTCFDHR
jgi:hypothetical protein